MFQDFQKIGIIMAYGQELGKSIQDGLVRRCKLVRRSVRD